MKITALEMELMNDIVTNEYANGQRGANVYVWTSSVIETRSRAAVLGSLVKKGLADRDNFGRDGDNEDACVWLTDAGFALWQVQQMAAANDKLEKASDEMEKALQPASKATSEANEASLRVDRIRGLLADLAGDAEFLMADSRDAANRGSVAVTSNDKLEQLEAALRNIREELHD